MLTTNVKVITNKFQDCVIKENVTPAEVLILCANYAKIVGNNPIRAVALTKREKLKNAPANLPDEHFWKESDKFETTEIERSDWEEMERLLARYRNDHLATLFPDQNNLKFPETFEHAVNAGLRNRKLGDSFMDGQIATMTCP